MTKKTPDLLKSALLSIAYHEEATAHARENSKAILRRVRSMILGRTILKRTTALQGKYTITEVYLDADCRVMARGRKTGGAVKELGQISAHRLGL
jgi:hypothetical protein